MLLFRHCALVVYGDESTAEHAASQANHSSVMGSNITTRGPADQRMRGLPGTYTGKIGYVPTKEGDKRPYTDCCHYASGVCTNSPVSCCCCFFKRRPPYQAGK